VIVGLPAAGLDPGWQGGLYMAAERGMHFGSHVIFTYGPLGFLAIPQLWYVGLARIAFAYQTVIHVLVCVTLVYGLRRSLGLVAAAVVGFPALIFAPATDLPTLLACAWCLIILQPRAPSWGPTLVAVGGGVLAGVETLVELRPGPVIALMCAVALLFTERRAKNLAVFAGSLLGTGVILWFATGQGIGNVGAFLSHGLQIVAGYSEIMGLPSGSGLAALAVAAGIAFVIAAAVTAAPDEHRRFGAGLVAAIFVFAAFKEAFVRADIYHREGFYAAVLLAGLSAFPAVRPGVVPRAAAVAGLVALGAVVIHTTRPAVAVFNPIDHARTAVDQVRMIVSDRRAEAYRVYAAGQMVQRYSLPHGIRALLGQHTVHVDPWDTGAAWLYRLHWDPLPVFQNYSAYTSALDRLNARALVSSTAPQRILRENTVVVDALHTPPGIDGRIGVWDPPGQVVAMMCNYVPLATTLRWQVLARAGNRCGVPHLVRSSSAGPGQTVEIPAAPPGEAVVGRIHGLGISGLERVRTWLYRAPSRWARLNGIGGVRIVPGTAADGLLLDVSSTSDYPPPFALSPGVRTISFAGFSGRLKIEIYEMPVRSLRAA
jgi:hypothetical protein